MEREKWLRGQILIIIWASIIILSSCDTYREENGNVIIRVQAECSVSKGYQDTQITDMSLIIFDHDGLAERCLYYEEGKDSFEVNLIKGRIYSVYLFANFGYHVFADHIEEIEELTFHLDKPEKVLDNTPLYGCIEGITADEDMMVSIRMDRLTAQIIVDIDRSRLSEDVFMEVTGIRIGNSPKQVKVTGNSKVQRSSERFEYGYSLSPANVAPLNNEAYDGISDAVALIMLENMQGDIHDMEVQKDSDKVFDKDDERNKLCSYLEIDLEYLSHSHFSGDGPLKYRLYLGDGCSNLDVERNCIYKIRLCPEDSGISEDSWRVDKSHILEFGPSRFQSFPESYIQGDIGDTIHLWCEFYPPHASFDIGLEELEYDKSQGIYDYIIDDDGHGVRLMLTGPGTGIVYMEAGTPINDAAMWIIEVNLPEQETESINSSQYENR